MLQLIKDEPVRFVSAIQFSLVAIAVILAQFAIVIPDVVIAAVILAIAAWMSLVTRSQVTPVR